MSIQDLNKNSKTILIVDDEPDIVEILQDYFDGEGWFVVTAHNCAEAERLSREYLFDVVLTDHHMPDGRGADLAAKLDTPCVIYTGCPDQVQAGNSIVVAKPASFSHLRSMVKMAISQQELEKNRENNGSTS